ncbi:alpha-1,2-fucosyltransferase [Mucilaginibacter sp. HC2]|uniref:alpha-1,2-fucosyltransferase n=1 Tax=Mucilaginibacter inviolabilis TaxID=2714892 RepID=UPI00140BB3B5|nr:alpha-1,2-fucosyltransferase [Mucilaginibacter inviolabilis]NHA04940.1 alpha-1,2-fucosyltransferase [Mucilaginibacter inviolabilis]
MIISKLQGGLGNQMFQYAAARNLSPNKPVYLDLSFLEKHTISTDSFTPREFGLSIFKNIAASTISKLRSNVILNPTLFNRLLKKVLFPNIHIVHENNQQINLDQNIIDRKVIYLDGYFQHEDYFKNIRSQLLKEFTFPALMGEAKSYADTISQLPNSVSIHVRRADYLKAAIAAYHGVLPLSYYKNAVELIHKSISNAHYFIFSDDTAWCRNNFDFLSDTATIIDINNQDWMDMALMSNCKHHIIANSSFSWWAAWLNPSTNKMVIAPRNWYAHQEKTDGNHHLIPKDWIRV